MVIDAELVLKLQRQRLRLGDGQVVVRAHEISEVPSTARVGNPGPTSPDLSVRRLSRSSVSERRRAFEGRSFERLPDKFCVEDHSPSDHSANQSLVFTDASTSPPSTHESLLSLSPSSEATANDEHLANEAVEHVPCEPEATIPSNAGQKQERRQEHGEDLQQQQQLLQNMRQRRLEGTDEPSGMQQTLSRMQILQSEIEKLRQKKHGGTCSLAAAAHRSLADRRVPAPQVDRGRTLAAVSHEEAQRRTTSASAASRELTPVDEHRAMAWSPSTRTRSASASSTPASLPPQPRAVKSRSRERPEQPLHSAAARRAGAGSSSTAASLSPQPRAVESRSRERTEQPPNNAAGRRAGVGSSRTAASSSPQPRALESRSRERVAQPPNNAAGRCAGSGIGSSRTAASLSPQPRVVKSRSRERIEQPPSNAAGRCAGVGGSSSSSSRHIPKNHNGACSHSQGRSSPRAPPEGAEGSRVDDQLYRLSQHLSAKGQRHRGYARVYLAMARQTEATRMEVLQQQRESARVCQGVVAAMKNAFAVKPTTSPHSTFR